MNARPVPASRHHEYKMKPYRQLLDHELTDLLKSGDHAAFTEIYNRYMGVLYVHALRMLKEEDEAEDILHEIFTALWTRSAQLELKSTLSAYLYRAVKNRVFDVLAHRKIRQSYIESLESFLHNGQYSTDEMVREQELARLIEQEIKLLPEKMRKVFELSRLANMSHKEIAATLGISDKTVKKQINNAIRILRLKINLLIAVLPL